MSRLAFRSGMVTMIILFSFFLLPVWVVCEETASGSGKMELADAIAKRQEEIRSTEEQIKKAEATRDSLLAESRKLQTQIKRTGLKDEAKASTRALETTREMYAKTREYNNLQQTQDDETNKAFADWCIAKGYWLIGEKKRQEWEATDEAKNLKQAQQAKKDGAYDKWKNEMDNLAKNGSKGFGIDSAVVDEQNQKQQDNLEAFKKNDEELDKLRNRLDELKKMSDHDYQREQEKPKEPTEEDDDVKPDHEYFFFSTAERMDKDTHLKINKMVNVPFSIAGGAPPYTLTSASVNSEDNRSMTIAKRPSIGEHYLFPISFSKAGTRSMEFTLQDSDGKRKSVTVVFYVEEDDEEEKKKDDEEFKKLQDAEYQKALEQARTLIAKGRASEAAAQAVIGKVTSALNAAQEAEGKVNGAADTIKSISDKTKEVNQLSSQATQLAPSVLNSNAMGEGIAKSAYDDVVKARSIACEISGSISNSSTPEADAQRADAAATDAEFAAAEVQGEGKTAAATYQSAKALHDQLWDIRRNMENLQVEIAGLVTKVSELPGIIDAAGNQVSAVAGSGTEMLKFAPEIESAKNGALGILNLYADRSEAQVLIGQANTLGSSLKSEKSADAQIQEAQAIIAKLQKSSSSVSAPAIVQFPVDTSALDEKVEELRTSADTIELFESRCQSEAVVARTCADSAKSIAESMESNSGSGQTGQTPDPNDGSGETPPWFSPTGNSVAGPQTPNEQSQTTSFKGATTTIQNNQQPLPPGNPYDPNANSPTGGGMDGHDHPQQPQQPQNPGSGNTPMGPHGCT